MTDNKPLSSAMLLLIGILLGALFVMLAVGVQIHDGGNFNFTLTTTGIPSGASTTTVYENVTYVTENGDTVTVQRADLRQVALPYLVAFPNFQANCVAAGGTYHETKDWVGCEGVGTLNCNTATAIAARTQCLGTEADFVCSATNIYCRYP
jgi:hypothetical protein